MGYDNKMRCEYQEDDENPRWSCSVDGETFAVDTVSINGVDHVREYSNGGSGVMDIGHDGPMHITVEDGEADVQPHES